MINSFGARQSLTVGGNKFEYFRLDAVGDSGIERLPYSLKILLENLLRHEDGANITADDIKALAAWDPKATPDKEIAFTPARVILQDFTGVPAIVDLAAMRDAMVKLGGKASAINRDGGSACGKQCDRVRTQPGTLCISALGTECLR
jgi:aconitate hydratase